VGVGEGEEWWEDAWGVSVSVSVSCMLIVRRCLVSMAGTIAFYRSARL
jgi:hypothetical protein